MVRSLSRDFELREGFISVGVNAVGSIGQYAWGGHRGTD